MKVFVMGQAQHLASTCDCIHIVKMEDNAHLQKLVFD